MGQSSSGKRKRVKRLTAPLKKPSAKKPKPKRNRGQAARTARASPPPRYHDADFEPFAVTATDIEGLDDLQFRRFMRDLLRNEVAVCECGTAQFIDNPGDGNDQGQDSETIRTTTGTVSDAFIPLGTTVWQYKAERKSPAERDFKRELEKDRPKAALRAGGNYRFIAQQPSVNESVNKDGLLKRIAKKKGYRAEQVKFHAQATLAERARLYPSLVLALPPHVRRVPDDVHHFDWWTKEHQTKFDETARSNELRQLSDFIRSTNRPAHIRVVGSAGVGKSRLVLHALTQLELGACTAYAPHPGSSFQAFFKWCDTYKGRVILVVDECDEPTAMQLRKSIVDHDLPILLVTVDKVEDPDIRANGRDLRIHLNPMKAEDVQRILDDGSIDKWRLPEIARITGGFVKLAVVVAQAVARDRNRLFDPYSLITTDIIREAVRSLLSVSEEAMRWFGTVALFSEVRVDSSELGSEFARLTQFAGVSVQDARAWNKTAIDAQVLSDRGGRIFETPALLAVLLARDVFRERKDDLPAWLGGLPARLREAFARQLGQLGYSEEGRLLAQRLVDATGPFGDLLAERQPWAREAFLALGTVGRTKALDRLERWVTDVPDAARDIATDPALQRLLFRLVWRPEHFDRAFQLLVRGLEASPDPAHSDLSRTIKSSLQLGIASSQAPFPDRFALAARAVRDRSLRPETRKLILRALASGTRSNVGDGYSRQDIDVDGREYWHPATYGEWRACIRSIVELLVEMVSDTALCAEAAANLIDRASDFILGGAHEPLLASIRKVLEIDPRVGTLREELERCVAFNKLPEEIDRAVRDAISALPQDLAARIRILAEGFPLVRDRDARDLPPRPNVDVVAGEIMEASDRHELIALLFEPWARNRVDMLDVLAKRSDAPEAWPAVLDAARERNETWAASVFLAVAHDAGTLRHTPVELLSSLDEFDRSLGAETIIRMDASDEELRALSVAVRRGDVKPAIVRYAGMGRWPQGGASDVVAELIRAFANAPKGGIAALAITYSAEANHGLTDDDLVRLLALVMFEIRGNDAWTWEQVGNIAAKTAPELLCRTLIAQIEEKARQVDDRYLQWADDEVARVIERCVEDAPSLAAALLDLWDVTPEFVEPFKKSILKHFDAETLGHWATTDRRQKTAAMLIRAQPYPITESLVARFGADSAFGRELCEQLYPRTWSGSLADLLRSRADEARRWAANENKNAEFRKWVRTSAEWLEKMAEKAARYDDV